MASTADHAVSALPLTWTVRIVSWFLLTDVDCHGIEEVRECQKLSGTVCFLS